MALRTIIKQLILSVSCDGDYEEYVTNNEKKVRLFNVDLFFAILQMISSYKGIVFIVKTMDHSRIQLTNSKTDKQPLIHRETFQE